ncbi:MAG: CU044_2847 family protein [Cyanobacteria bacterium J06638_22]
MMQTTSASGSRPSDPTVKRVQVDLGDGVIVQMDVEVGSTGLQEVSGGTRLPFTRVLQGMTKVAEVVAGSIQKVKPDKATVKYGLEIGIEEGSLMAAVVRGSGSANFEITLEWENTPGKEEKTAN